MESPKGLVYCRDSLPFQATLSTYLFKYVEYSNLTESI